LAFNVRYILLLAFNQVPARRKYLTVSAHDARIFLRKHCGSINVAIVWLWKIICSELFFGCLNFSLVGTASRHTNRHYTLPRYQLLVLLLIFSVIKNNFLLLV